MTDRGLWKCDRCAQVFKKHSRYTNHLTSREFISCRFCSRPFCRHARYQQHERSEHPQPLVNTLQPTTVGGNIDLDVPIIGDTKYQKQKGYAVELRKNDSQIRD